MTTPPKKIILISLDTLRADHMGCYGYPRNTSPTIDVLAKEGILFKNAFSPSSHTIPAHGSIFTGKYPSKHTIGFNQNIFVETGKLDTDIDITLAETLKNCSFNTSAFISGIVLGRKTNLNAGFDYYDDNIGDDPYGRRKCADTNQKIFDWVTANKTQNFFLFVHYFDAHGPYHCPNQHQNLFLNDQLYTNEHLPENRFDTNPDLNAIPNYQLLKIKKDQNENIVDFEKKMGYYLAQYDGCIRYLDDNLGLFFEKLRQLGIYDETLIIITSDHGEAFGENEVYFYHGLTVTPEQIRVPLIVKPHKEWAVESGILEVPVSTLDILPTLLDICNSSYSDPDIQGISLKKYIESRIDPILNNRTIMSENESQCAFIYPNHIMELVKKETPSSNFYPCIPELINSLNGKQFYWDTGMEYTLSLPFDIYQRYKLVSDIINKFRKTNEPFKILDIGAGFEETLKKFLPNDKIYCLDNAYPPEYSQKRSFIVGDIFKKELPEKYDFVVAIDVYEHIPPDDRKRFVDILISSSTIASILGAPFDTENVKNCEFFANEVYKTSHGSDYIWLKEHIENGLPSLSLTIDLIKDYNLHPIVIPNGYLPHWIEMLSTFLLTEGKQDLSAMMTNLNEFYNQNYYQFDNKDPAYRKVIIVPKEKSDIDFSDLFSHNNNLEKLAASNQKLSIVGERIKKSGQIKDREQKDNIITNNEKIMEFLPIIQSMLQISIAKDEKLAKLSSTNQELINQLHAKDLKISSMEQSITWQFKIKFHKIVEKIFPQNTRRRNYYNLGVNGGRILVNEGIGKFFWYYNERRRVKKNERSFQRTLITDNVQNTVKRYSHSTIDQIKFSKTGDEIEVSIIIPIFNQFQYTLNCLKSISENTTGSFEVIIVDDASSDERITQLKSIPNLKIVRNDVNLGFIDSCNNGAKHSKGKILLFLNNDTVVTKNWLSPMLDLIKREDVGAVGSKLIYPDGKLQEAGGIIWNDASGWNYGRRDNPEKPEYNFVREVDYCSGAALLVKRELFEKNGGFDNQFRPAYYEDVDLCFSIRRMGYKIFFQPASEVIHFEGVSNGTNVAEGVKQNQINNKEKFLNKWKDILQTSHYAPDSQNLFSARSRSSGRKILVIDQYVPFFDRDAGSYRMLNILKILGELRHKVTFIGDNFTQFDPYDTIVEQSGIEVICFPFVNSIKEYLMHYGENFEIVIVSRPYIAQKHIADIRNYCTHAKVIYDTVDLQFLRESRLAEVKKDPQLKIHAEVTKKTELQLAKESDVTLVVSKTEQEILKNEDPHLNVQIVSLIHDINLPTKNFSQRKDILFLGAFLHLPNADGVLWFIREIFPKIKKEKPAIKIFIVGDCPSEEILALSSEDIIVTGYVKDLTDYFNSCKVFIAPLRFGAGVKGKINQSMSNGLPVVTTSIGAEGMGVVDGKTILIADDPDLFSQQVIRLYDDEKLWNQLSQNSLEHIKNNTSYEQSKKMIAEFIDTL